MSGKRRKEGEPPTDSSEVASLVFSSTDLPPPAKAPRTTAVNATPSCARRFGFKGPSISQLPASLVTMKTKPLLASDLHPIAEDFLGKNHIAIDASMENVNLQGLNLHISKTFREIFGQDTVATLDQLLSFRPKANKFAVKARKEEQINYIKQLKTGLRNIVEKIQEFSKISTTMDETLSAEKATLERRQAVLLLTAKSKAQLEAEVKKLQEQNRMMQKTITSTSKSEQDAIRRNAELRDNAAKQEIKLEEALKINDNFKLELKTHETRLENERQRSAERIHELRCLYDKKGDEDSKRNKMELEKLQAQCSKAREELAAALKVLDEYKDKAIDAANKLNDERERRTRFEMEGCTFKAKNQALEARVSSTASDVIELKEKLQHKDEEVSNLVRSLTEIQRFNASVSTKVEADKKELADKVEQFQKAIRLLEQKDLSSSTIVRDLRMQLDLEIQSRKEAEKSELELHAQVKHFKNELQQNLQKVGVEGGVRQMLEGQVRELRTEHIAVNAQMEAVKAEMKRLQSASVLSKEQHQHQLDLLVAKFQQEKEQFKIQIDTLQEEKVSLESEVQTLRARVTTARDVDIEELCNVKREADILRRRLGEMTNQGVQSIAMKDGLILELQEKIKQGDKQRRAMHNTIQVSLLLIESFVENNQPFIIVYKELRGNVRVFARTRPFLPSDHCDPTRMIPVISCDFDGESLKLLRPGKNASQPDSFAFTFDKVFAPSAGQDAVFEHVCEFVQSSMDGYHVCLFSYGQTGSGKTHTMQGSGNGQMRGIIPRAIEMILQECEALKNQGWNYTTKVSFLEIYNETLNDLLVEKHANDEKLCIKKDARGGVYVPGLTMVDVTAVEQVEVLMEQASRVRSVACTDMNAQSSRSHSVFSLHLQGVKEKDGVVLNGQLNLVDLAGSERASRSNVSGDRLKETQAINKSLSCLADVFNAIGNKASHIPFRNSKLTYLLQSSLSGDGKTLMMVNLSPTLESASESLCSLRFAKQVNQCELGKPKRQIKSSKDNR